MNLQDEIRKILPVETSPPLSASDIRNGIRDACPEAASFSVDDVRARLSNLVARGEAKRIHNTDGVLRYSWIGEPRSAPPIPARDVLRTDAVLKALQDAAGPVANSAIGSALDGKYTTPQITHSLKVLRGQGLVQCTGEKSRARWSVTPVGAQAKTETVSPPTSSNNERVPLRDSEEAPTGSAPPCAQPAATTSVAPENSGAIALRDVPPLPSVRAASAPESISKAVVDMATASAADLEDFALRAIDDAPRSVLKAIVAAAFGLRRIATELQQGVSA
jgi:hypothetical protein